MRSGRDVAAALDRHPLARDRLLLHHEGNELSGGALRLDLTELLRTRELLVECTTPREPSRDRIRLRCDVVPVQGVAHLEAKRVACSEPTRNSASFHDRSQSSPASSAMTRSSQ